VAFERRFVRQLPFGVCSGVSLPAIGHAPAGGTNESDEADEADGAGWEPPPELHAREAEFARALSPFRRASWVGGRVALRAALAAIGVEAAGPILATARGAPALPAGAVGSVSHKSDLAVALVARASGTPPAATLGIDVEAVRSFRHDIAGHVLTPDERAALPPDGPARDREVLRLFSAKEAIYKALDPWVQRFVSFHEATIVHGPPAAGGLIARLALARAEGPFTVEIHDASDGDALLLAARVTPLGRERVE
jgi:enterobactin synthetase component D